MEIPVGVTLPVPARERATLRALVLALFVAGWAAAVAAGVWLLWSYANRPGPAAPGAATWPLQSVLRPDPERATLVMFIYPQCPCSRASVDQLDTLLARAAVKPRVVTVFIRPAGTEPDWEKKGLWSSAAAIPGVETLVDPEGAEARRFGVRTSGHVLLFGPDGALRFSGGITAARGHSGDNRGLSEVLERLKNGALPRSTTPVFGCQLFAGVTREDQP